MQLYIGSDKNLDVVVQCVSLRLQVVYRIWQRRRLKVPPRWSARINSGHGAARGSRTTACINNEDDEGWGLKLEDSQKQPTSWKTAGILHNKSWVRVYFLHFTGSRWFFPCIVGLDELMVSLKFKSLAAHLGITAPRKIGCSMFHGSLAENHSLTTTALEYYCMVSLVGGLIVNILEGPGAASTNGSADSASDAKNTNDEQWPLQYCRWWVRNSSCPPSALWRSRLGWPHSVMSPSVQHLLTRMGGQWWQPSCSNKGKGAWRQFAYVRVNVCRKFPSDSFRHQKFFQKIDSRAFLFSAF